MKMGEETMSLVWGRMIVELQEKSNLENITKGAGSLAYWWQSKLKLSQTRKDHFFVLFSID